MSSNDDAALARAAIRALRAPSPPADASHLLRFLARPENILIVATRAEAPVGLLLAYALPRVDRPAPMVCLYEIEVVPSERRCGVGRAMIEALKEHCAGMGATKIWGVTNRSNRPARSLFAATGARIDPDGDDLVFTYQ